MSRIHASSFTRADRRNTLPPADRFTIQRMEIIGQKARIHRPYEVQYANPIAVLAGETLTIGQEDDEFPGWRWCRASDGREGWVPVELLSIKKRQAVILQDYSARELQVRPGEDVVVEDARHGWLLVRNVKGERGWIPADRVCDPS